MEDVWYLLRLELDKKVVITNTRLRFMYTILFLIVTTLCIWNFIDKRSYTKTVRLRTRPALRVDASAAVAAFSDYEDRGTRHPSCMNYSKSHILPPRSSLGLEWFDIPLGCQGLCNFTTVSSFSGQTQNCENIAPLIQVRSSQDIFFATTHHRWRADNHSKRIEWTANPWLGNAFFELTFFFSAIETPEQFLWLNPSISPGRSFAVHGNHQHATTILLDGLGRPRRIIGGGQNLKLRVAEAVALTQGLTDRNFEMLPINVVKDGLEIIVYVDCWSDLSDVRFVEGDVELSSLRASHRHPVCVVRFLLSESHASMTKLDVLHREMTGIHILADDTNTMMRFPSFTAILLHLASILVLLHLPRSMIGLFSMHCLGRFSELHKQVVHEKFSIPSLCASWAVQLVSTATIFSQLSDTSASGNKMLSKKQFEVALQAALHDNPVLDKFEIHRIARYSLKYMFQRFETDWDSDMSMTLFAEMATADRATKYETLAAFLDQNRKRFFLERVFTPRKLVTVYAPRSKQEEEEVSNFNRSQSSAIFKHQRKKKEAGTSEQDTKRAKQKRTYRAPKTKLSTTLTTTDPVASSTSIESTDDEQMNGQHQLMETVQRLVEKDYQREQAMIESTRLFETIQHRLDDLQRQLELQASWTSYQEAVYPKPTTPGDQQNISMVQTSVGLELLRQSNRQIETRITEVESKLYTVQSLSEQVNRTVAESNDTMDKYSKIIHKAEDMLRTAEGYWDCKMHRDAPSGHAESRDASPALGPFGSGLRKMGSFADAVVSVKGYSHNLDSTLDRKLELSSSTRGT